MELESINIFQQLKDYIALQFATNEFFSGAFLTGVVIALVAFLKGKVYFVYNYLISKYTVTININSMDESFYYFQKWLSSHNFSNTFKRFSVVSGKGTNNNNSLCDTVESGEEEKKHILLAPYSGSYIFKYKGKRIWLNYEIKEPSGTKGSNMILMQEITLKFLGRSTKIIESIIADIESDFNKEAEKKIKIYTPKYDYWSSKIQIRKRSLDTVILKEGMRDEIVDDITKFIGREEWYADRGVPYHRSYLFHGIPGSGKTSIIYALASHFEKDVYFLSLTSTMKSEDLIALMSDVDEKSLIVLEDVDVVFKGKDSDRKMDDKMNLDFSTLINVIDGFCSKHGTLLFMTTNKKEVLDPALIRPGRVDVDIEFKNCDKYQISNMTDGFFHEHKMGARLADIIPDNSISPATLQGHLIKHIDNPEEIIDNIGEIMEVA